MNLVSSWTDKIVEKGFRYRIALPAAAAPFWALYRWEWVGGQCPRRYGWTPVTTGEREHCENTLKNILAPDDTVERNGVVCDG